MMESIVARQHICRRALLPALGLGVCMAAMTAAVQAQDYVDQNGLMYVKRLIVSPLPHGAEADKSTIETDPPPPPQPKGFYETELKLRASEPDGEGGITRVIKGVPSKAGYWKSAVNIEIAKGLPGASSCGASVIDRRWVLTAAHCVFDQRRGGLRPLEWVSVYEGSHQYKKGRHIRVVEAHVHKQFKILNQNTASEQLINDVALLKLEKDAQVDRQKLAAYSGTSKFLTTGNIATIVGWGKTEQNKASPILLQADVPIVAETACHAIYPQVGKVAFCAGYKQGGVDTCQGDSGGPLYVAGTNGEHIQAGITSFGKGCAQPDAYGVYTNLGLFEQWIKDIVPNAYFVQPPSGQAGSYLEKISGFKLGGPPSPHGQVSVDLKHVPCPSTVAADVVTKDVNQIKAGSCIRIRVTSGVTGHIRVLSLNAKGVVHTVFPNDFSGGEQVGATDGSIQAGRTIGIPGGGDSFYFKVDPPYGKAHVIAIVAGEAVGLPKIAQGRALQRTTEELVDELAEIDRQITAHPLVPRAVGTRQYEVVE
jgi:V8-like Glu-specific endopeptidase